jgi:hypothetical protein
LVSEIERRIKILEYLRENSLDKKIKKINKSDVMRHLEPISRLKTTHTTIINLIDEGKIKMIKDKPHSQTHYLTINEKNEFNKSYDSLLEIEDHIDAMNGFTAAIYEIMRAELKEKDKDHDTLDESNAGHLLSILYRDPYESAIDKMLHFFLLKVSELHLNAEDSEILYRKIANLFLKMLSQRGIQDLKKATNQKLNYIIMTNEDDIKKHVKYFRKYASIYDKYKIDFGLKDDLVQLMKNFQEGFLS